MFDLDAEIGFIGLKRVIGEGRRGAGDRQFDIQRAVLKAAAFTLEAHRNALRITFAVQVAAADFTELNVDQLPFVHHAFVRYVEDGGLNKYLRHRVGAETAVGRP
ncbi:hypothetical protein D3C73_1123650 [compost metagenome]